MSYALLRCIALYYGGIGGVEKENCFWKNLFRQSIAFFNRLEQAFPEWCPQRPLHYCSFSIDGVIFTSSSFHFARLPLIPKKSGWGKSTSMLAFEVAIWNALLFGQYFLNSFKTSLFDSWQAWDVDIEVPQAMMNLQFWKLLSANTLSM